MWRFLRLIFDRRLAAMAVFAGLATGLFVVLEPRPRFTVEAERQLAVRGFTPDSKCLILTKGTGNSDGPTTQIQLRSASNGRAIHDLAPIRGDTPIFAMGGDGETILASTDKEAVAWRAADWTLVARSPLPGLFLKWVPGPGIRCLIAPPADRSSEVSLLDIAKGKVLGTFGPIQCDGPVPVGGAQTAISADGSRIATFGWAAGENVLRVWDAATGKMLVQHTIPLQRVIALEFLPGNDSVIGAGMNSTGRSLPGITSEQVLFTLPAATSGSGRFVPWAQEPFASWPTRNPLAWAWTNDLREFHSRIDATGRQWAIELQNGCLLVSFDIEKMGSQFRFDLGRLSPDFRSSVKQDYLMQGSMQWKGGICINKHPSGEVVGILASDPQSSDYLNPLWVPGGKYVAFSAKYRSANYRLIANLLRKIGINIGYGGNVSDSLVLLDPKTTQIVASLPCVAPSSTLWSPDGNAVYVDGAVYDVPFRKPWWAIIGLPFALALIIWGPWRKRIAAATDLL